MTFAGAKAAMKDQKRELDAAIRAGDWEQAVTLAGEFTDRLHDVAAVAFEESRR